MSKRLAGVTEFMAANLASPHRHNVTTFGGSHHSYGWRATLELLLPPSTAASRHTFTLSICPACSSVHETGGGCSSSRHYPATAEDDNILELNSRVLQQLIAANLTLAEACDWIQRLTRNESGNVTSFPLVVTDEVYTIGFDTVLMNVLPNMVVISSGNYSQPPPPVRHKEWYEVVWNTLTGIAEWLWDGFVAACTFIANLPMAVVNFIVGFAIAIATGHALEYLYEKIVKPFVDLVLWFIRWIIDLVSAVIRFLFSPILNAFENWKRDFVNTVSVAINEVNAENPSPEEHAKRAADLVVGFLWTGTLALVFALFFAILAAETIGKPFFAIVGSVLQGLAMSLICAAFGLSMIPTGTPPSPGDNADLVQDQVVDYIPNSAWWQARAPFVTGRFLSTVVLLIFQKASLVKLRTVAAIVLAIGGLVLFMASPAIGNSFGWMGTIVVSVAGLALSLLGLYYAITSELKVISSLAYSIGVSFAVASLLVALMSTARAL